MTTPVERVARILHRARVAGGWDDEDVAAAVLRELNGVAIPDEQTIAVQWAEPPSPQD